MRSAPPWRRATLGACSYLLFALAVGLPTSGVAQTLPADDLDVQALLRQFPETPTQLAARQAFAARRLKQLAPTTQPAPATLPSDGGDSQPSPSLYEAWSAYAVALDRLETLRNAASEETQADAAREITDQIESADAAKKRWRAWPVRIDDSAEALQQAQQDRNALDARITVLSEGQSDRAALLQSGFAQQRAELRERLEALGREQEQARRQTTTMPATASAGHAEAWVADRERVLVQIATTEVRLRNIDLEQKRTERSHRSQDRLLAAMREQQTALSEYIDRLTAHHDRSLIEKLEEAYQQASEPVDRAEAGLRLFVERVDTRHLRPSRLVGNVNDQRELLQQIDQQIRLATGRWEQALNALAHYPAPRLSELRGTLRGERRVWQDRDATLRKHQADLLDTQLELESIRQRALEEYDKFSATILSEWQQSETATADLAVVEGAVAAQRAELRDRLRVAFEQVIPLLSDVEAASERVSEHLAQLHDVAREIRWRQLTRRGTSVLGADWPELVTAGTSLLIGLTVPANEDATASTEVGVLRPASTAEDQARRARRRAGQALDSTSDYERIATVAVVLLAITIGYGIRRLARVRSRRLTRRMTTSDSPATFRRRIRLLFWHLWGDLAIPLLAGGTLMIAVAWIVDDGPTARMLLAIAGMLLTLSVLTRIVRRMFEPDSALRPVPCDDLVAQHYRRCARIVAIWALLTLTPAVLLDVTGLASQMAATAYSVFKIGILLVLLLAMIPKRRAIGTATRYQPHWLRSILVPSRFLGIAALAGLLALEIAGYSVLVTWAAGGAGLTLLLLLILVAGTEFLVDQLRLNEHGLSTSPSDDADAGSDDTEARTSTGTSQSLLRILLRLAALSLFMLGTLWIWDIPISREWISVRVLGLALLTILVGVVVDRVVVTALASLERAERLPANTTGLIRRWGRGAIVLLAALAIASLGGLQVGAILTFLTTLLAMVAIGFVAVWSVLSNLLATLIILVWRPFNVGEDIELLPEGVSGRVVDINFMYTTLRDDHTHLSVPNSLFAQKFIRRSVTRRQPQRTLVEQLEANEALSS